MLCACLGPQYTTFSWVRWLQEEVCGRDLAVFSGDERTPQSDRAGCIEKQDSSQKIKAIAEDGLGSAGMGFDHDLPVFGAPLTGCVGEGEGQGEHGHELVDALGMDEMGVLEIEAA